MLPPSRLQGSPRLQLVRQPGGGEYAAAIKYCQILLKPNRNLINEKTCTIQIVK